MDLKLVKSLCNSAFDAYKQPAHKTDRQWDNWIKSIYPDAKTFSRDGCQAFSSNTDNHTLVSFRGTDKGDFLDLFADIKFRGKKYDYGTVHRGFDGFLDKIFDLIVRSLHGERLIVTGHSLGGALATLFALRMELKQPGIIKNIVTFGSPRVGGKKFAGIADKLFGDRALRVVNNNDLIPRIPHSIPFCYLWGQPQYTHCFDELYIDRAGVGKTNPSCVFKLYDRILGYRLGDLLGEHSTYKEKVSRL